MVETGIFSWGRLLEVEKEISSFVLPFEMEKGFFVEKQSLAMEAKVIFFETLPLAVEVKETSSEGLQLAVVMVISC